MLDERSDAQKLVVSGLSPDDGVRVPDVYRCHFEAFAVYLERFGLPHVGFAEVDLDILALDARGNGAFSDVQPWECDAAPSCKPHGGNASAVPGKLSGRPVRVPDDDLCLCTSHFADLEHTVGAHPQWGSQSLRTSSAPSGATRSPRSTSR